MTKEMHPALRLNLDGEEQSVTMPDEQADTGLRIRCQAEPDGCVRLERLAYSQTMGWYVQKSFCIPEELLSEVLLQLRKIDCLRPRGRGRYEAGAPLRLCPDAIPTPPQAQRRQA